MCVGGFFFFLACLFLKIDLVVSSVSSIYSQHIYIDRLAHFL